MTFLLSTEDNIFLDGLSQCNSLLSIGVYLPPGFLLAHNFDAILYALYYFLLLVSYRSLVIISYGCRKWQDMGLKS